MAVGSGCCGDELRCCLSKGGESTLGGGEVTWAPVSRDGGCMVPLVLGLWGFHIGGVRGAVRINSDVSIMPFCGLISDWVTWSYGFTPNSLFSHKD